MKKIEIACAGAGKTYGLAEKIMIQHLKNDGRKIYSITFTNNAVEKITSEIILRNGSVPDNIVIQTVHKFLLEEIIYPFSFFCLGERINSCSIMKLDDNDKYKASQKKKLKDEGIVHSEEVYKYAAKILCYRSIDRKKEKEKKDIILEMFVLPIDTIFIDEVQDLNEDFFELINRISTQNINIYMVGDFRQSLKHTHDFINFTKSNNFEKPIINNITRRMPQIYLDLTNKLYDEEYACTTISALVGKIFYAFYNEINCKNFYENYDLKYIREKNEYFSTSKISNHIYLDKNIKKKIIINSALDEEAYLFWFEMKIKQLIVEGKSIRDAVSKVLSSIKVRLEKNEFASICKQFIVSEHDTIKINSIEKIKGLEGENCLFILDKSLFELLIGKKENLHNKETNMLYVALTRSLKDMTILLLDDILKFYSKKQIEDELKKMNISPL